jgi:hypothetical protein
VNAPDGLLGVADVMGRYGLRDRRAARRVMDEVGSFVVATNLYVRRLDLLGYEDAQKAARKAQIGPPARAEGNPRLPARKTPAPRTEPLRPGWWRNEVRAGSLAPPEPGGNPRRSS